MPSTTTSCDLLLKMEDIQLWTRPSMPNKWCFWRIRLCDNLSNAFLFYVVDKSAMVERNQLSFTRLVVLDHRVCHTSQNSKSIWLETICSMGLVNDRCQWTRTIVFSLISVSLLEYGTDYSISLAVRNTTLFKTAIYAHFQDRTATSAATDLRSWGGLFETLSAGS